MPFIAIETDDRHPATREGKFASERPRSMDRRPEYVRIGPGGLQPGETAPVRPRAWRRPL